MTSALMSARALQQPIHDRARRAAGTEHSLHEPRSRRIAGTPSWWQVRQSLMRLGLVMASAFSRPPLYGHAEETVLNSSGFQPADQPVTRDRHRPCRHVHLSIPARPFGRISISSRFWLPLPGEA